MAPRQRTVRGTQIVVLRRTRADLLRGTALQAAAAVMVVFPAVGQPAPGARPQGGQVVVGGATINQQNAAVTQVDQSTHRAAIDWRSFDVGRDHAVVFAQPSASAVTLNRVTGSDPSAIAGQIRANGQVVITNPSGVVFHRGAQVDAQSLIVSAAGITNQNFMAGRMVFDQRPNPDARVDNQGTITVKEAGLAALVAPQVSNSGTITAKLGRAMLGGADTHTLDLYGDGLLSLDVTNQVRQVPRGADGKPAQALVTNTGTIAAEGGTVQLTAAAADGLIQTLVRSGGRVEAPTAAGRRGRIELSGNGGSVVVEGVLHADGHGPSDPGGEVVVMASGTVAVGGGAHVSASGRGGGGTVALGTTLSRAQEGRTAALAPVGSPLPSVPAGTARQVAVAPGARVAADGWGTGSGGTVAVLSKGETQVAGRLSARGGRRGGNGGVVEASSVGELRLDTAPDVAALRGRGGTVFLDPENMEIIASPAPGQAQAPFNVVFNGTSETPANETPPNPVQTGTSFIQPATLEAASRGGTATIRLQARSNLTVTDPVNLATGVASASGGTGGASLILQAGNNLAVNADLRLASSTVVTGNPTPSLTLLARNQIFIGQQGFGPSIPRPNNVVISAQGNLDFRTGDQAVNRAASLGSISIRNDSVVETEGNLSLRAIGQIDIGPRVRLRAGPTPGGTGAPVTLRLLAGTDVVLASDVQVQATSGSLTIGAGNPAAFDAAVIANVGLTPPAATPISPDPAGSVRIGTGTALTAATSIGVTSGSTGAVTFDAGSSVTSGSSMTVTGGNAGITIGAGTALTAATTVDIATGPTGAVTFDAGSTVTSRQDMSVRSGSLGTSISGTLRTGAFSDLDLTSDGAVTQAASGAVITSGLGGSAASYALTSRLNQVNNTGSSSSGASLSTTAGDMELVDSVSLVVGNQGSSPGGGISVPSGRSVVLTTDSLDIGAPPFSPGFTIIRARAGTITVRPFTGVTVELQDGPTKTPGRLSITAGELGRMQADRLQFGSSSTAALVVAPGGGTVNVTTPSAGSGNGFRVLELESAGAITEAGGVMVDTLRAIGSDVSLTNPANQIGELGTSGATSGYFALATRIVYTGSGGSVPLVVSGDVTVPLGRTLSLTADRIIVQSTNANGVPILPSPILSAPSGTVALAPLTSRHPIELVARAPSSSATVLSIGSDLLAAVSTSTLQVGTTGAGPIGVGDSSGAISLAGHAATLRLLSGDAITEGNILAVSTLTGSAASASLGRANTVGTLAAFDTTSGFSLTNAAPLQVAGPVADPALIALRTTSGDLTLIGLVSTAGTLDLSAAGRVEQIGGTVTAGTLTGSAASASLGVANAVGTLGAFSTTGGFGLTNAATLQVVGPVTDPALIALRTTAGDLTLTGLVSTLGTLNLSAANSVAQFGGTMQADTLTGSAGSLLLTGQSNRITYLGPYTATTRLALTDARGLAVSGTVTAPDVALTTAGDLAINAPLGNGTVALNAVGGAITQGTGSTLTATTLSGSAASASLDGANTVGTLGAFSTTGGFSLTNAGPLQVAGPVTDPLSVALRTTSGDLTLGGPVSLAGTLDLSAARNVVQSGGAVTAGTLTGNAGSLLLTGPGNRVTNLGPYTATVRLALTDARSLAVSGTVTAPDVALATVGDLAINAPLGNGTVALNATGGAITQGPGGALAATVLTGSAGSVTLAPAGASVNTVNELGGFTTATGFTLRQDAPLLVSGTVRDGTRVSLDVGGLLDLRGTVAAPDVVLRSRGTIRGGPGDIVQSAGLVFAPGQATFTADGSIQQTGGRIETALLQGSAGGQASFGSATNQIAALGGFTSNGFVLADGRSLTLTGPITNTQGISLNVVGDLALADAVSAPNVDLRATGVISQPGGAVTAGTLTGNAGSLLLTGPGNRVTNLGPYTATVRLALTDARSLAVTGAVTAPDVALATAGDLAINAPLGNGTVALNATGGAITQGSGGALAATVLTGSAADATLTQAGNSVAALGSFSATGTLALTTSGALDVTGPVQARQTSFATAGDLRVIGSLNAGTLQLAVAGAVEQAPGSQLTVNLLSGQSAGSLQLGGPGAGTASIGTLGPFTVTAGTLALTNSAALRIAGELSAPFLAITAPGSITLDGGSIVTTGASVSQQSGAAPAPSGSTLQVLGAGGSGQIVQTGTTTVTSLGGSTATLRLELPATGGSMTFSDLRAESANLVLATGAGFVSGNVTVGSLLVIGSGGGSALSGQVGGQGGDAAAQAGRILPRIDVAYLFSGCVIQSASCVLPPPPPPFDPRVFQSFLAPQGILQPVNLDQRRPDLFNLILLPFLTFVPEPEDEELLLPNISDRDN